MQHLDDGTIHALLDGELSTEAAEALAEHVRYCAACADRLAEERLIQTEAERMIAELDAPAAAAAAAPAGDGPIAAGNEAFEPPMAPDQPQYSGPPVVLIPERDYERGRIPRLLGWAATLIVAAGAGWFASVARQPAPPSVMLPEVQDAAAGAYLADSASGFSDSDVAAKATGPADSGAAGVSTALEGGPPDSAPLIVEEAEGERDPEAVAATPPPPLAEAREDSRQATSQRASAPRDSAGDEVAQSEALRREASEDRAEPPTPAATPARTAAGAAAARAPSAASTPSALEQQSQIRMRLGLDETQRMLGSGLHVIDGLQQQFVGLVDGRLVAGANPNAPVVRVVYLDDQRRPIFLDQQRLDGTRRQMGLARDSVPPDWVKGDVWLSLKGNGLSASELAELARRVR